MAMALKKQNKTTKTVNGSTVITRKSSIHISGRKYFMALCFSDTNIFLSFDFWGGNNCSSGK